MDQIVVLHRQRWTGAQIAAGVGVNRATVGPAAAGARAGAVAGPRALSSGIQRATPAELLHVDTKKLGRILRPGCRVTGTRRGQPRGAGWECAHVCVDDASRLAYVEVLPDERSGTARGFLRRAVRWLGNAGRAGAARDDRQWLALRRPCLQGSLSPSWRTAAAHAPLGTLVLLDRGDEVEIQSGDDGIRFLLVSGQPLKEPVAWYGPIVMNTQEVLRHAFAQLDDGTSCGPSTAVA